MTIILCEISHFIGIGLICLLFAAIIIKVAWNLWSAYDLIINKPRPGVRIYPLIEMIPLVLAVVIALLTKQDGVFAASELSFWGSIIVFVSYVHLVIVVNGWMVAKLIFCRHRHRQTMQAGQDEVQNGDDQDGQGTTPNTVKIAMPLEREAATYRREVERLLAEGHAGRHALIKGRIQLRTEHPRP